MDKRLAQARQALEQGYLETAAELLKPLVDAQDAEALFLRSTFSLPGEESESMFEKRSLQFLKRSAELNYAPALYALGVCYSIGDLVSKNERQATQYFKTAAALGYSKAKYEHGRNLLYGAPGLNKQVESGWQLIREAAADDVEDASIFIHKFARKSF